MASPPSVWCRRRPPLPPLLLCTSPRALQCVIERGECVHSDADTRGHAYAAMGGTASHHQGPRKSLSAAGNPTPPAEPRPPDLSDRQKELLRETWRELEDNIAKVGVITFISLFETHPDVQAVFMPFSGLELDELRHSKQLRAHALRVMAFVQKAVARLHEPEKLQCLLEELGRKHHHYGAKQQYVDLIGPQFIQAIQPSLEERWTSELQQAWVQLFQYMAYVMKAAMEQERQCSGQ